MESHFQKIDFKAVFLTIEQKMVKKAWVKS